MDHSLPDSSVHGILQARIMEWAAMPSSRGSFWPKDGTWVSYFSCIGRWVLYLGSPIFTWGDIKHYESLGAIAFECWWLLHTHPPTLFFWELKTSVKGTFLSIGVTLFIIWNSNHFFQLCNFLRGLLFLPVHFLCGLCPNQKWIPNFLPSNLLLLAWEFPSFGAGSLMT